MKTSIFQNSNKNIVKISALKFLLHPGDLVNKKAYRKPQRSYKNFQGREPYNIYVANLENPCPRKFVLSLTDLYVNT